VAVELMNKLIAWLADRYLSVTWPAAVQAEADHFLAIQEQDREVWEPQELRFPDPKPNPDFDDLPTVQVLSARITDDDNEFISDLRYLRDLKIEIFAHASVFGAADLKPMPTWPSHPNYFEDIA